jgi:hypothetical protein
MTKQKLLVLLFLYVISTGAAFGISSRMTKDGTIVLPGQEVAETETTPTEEEEDNSKRLLVIDPKAPKDQPCPLNGKMYTATEKDAWEKRRPLAVMIENSPDSRPQSGLGKADIVFEAMAEGGVTRFMAMFYCDVQVEDTTVAPVRSARTYFVDWASGFNLPLYVHVGGANTPGPSDALGQISDYGWNGQNDLNQFSIGYPTFVRDYNRIPGKELATEHTMVSSTEKLWAVATKRGWTNLSPERKVGKKTTGGVDWKEGFKPLAVADDAPAGSPTAANISFEFWDGFENYGVKYEYDKASNAYKRFLAGQPHTDLNNDKQVMVKNAIVLFSEEKGPINDKKHLLYKTTGTGEAWIFQNGDVIKGKWAKKDREAQLTFVDSKGKEVPLVRGLTWISVVAPKTVVTYQ